MRIFARETVPPAASAFFARAASDRLCDAFRDSRKRSALEAPGAIE